MTYETKTTKSYDGSWRAESQALLAETEEGKRFLELATYKDRGGITTSANVFVYKQSQGFTTKSTVIFGDFSKSKIAFTDCNRVTEQAVSQAHKFALLQMPKIIAEAKAFYEEKETNTTD
ncbi:hypothetical protein BFP97_06400 [Roseivirga sp. 4D4]|uniref:hypothetical protein n=1 Tax=Roseivirga sp. 4D4 TaxID=1889784 RepID=UPI000853AFBD|nr:hypothetical protein [Roseivirga sp. 4D4]OEK01162.1 hypothetical protein BFP97_06400 [Roseivirga sp. 4D4]